MSGTRKLVVSVRNKLKVPTGNIGHAEKRPNGNRKVLSPVGRLILV